MLARALDGILEPGHAGLFPSGESRPLAPDELNSVGEALDGADYFFGQNLVFRWHGV
jgi:hypothetical protein